MPKPLTGVYPIAEGEKHHKSKIHRVRGTGEYRNPRRGEWFLSGAIIEGYEALNDMTRPFHIAKLVKRAPEMERWEDL